MTKVTHGIAENSVLLIGDGEERVTLEKLMSGIKKETKGKVINVTVKKRKK